MKFDQEAYDRQVATQKAETARLKALWDKENAVDTGARRAAAAKAAAEKEARETPSPEDQARGKEIFDKVHHHWRRQGFAPNHRLLLAADEKTVHKHVFSFGISHPFRNSAWSHTVTLPADKFANDLRWCVLTVDHNIQREWTVLLEQEARDQRRQVEHLAKELAEHEERQKPKPPPPEPEPINFHEYDGLKALTEGQEIKGMISVKVVSIDKKTGDLKLLVTDHGVDHKHVLAGREYTFELHESWEGDYNMWSLRDEEHECWNGHSHDADLLVVYDHGTWLFDLDS